MASLKRDGDGGGSRSKSSRKRIKIKEEQDQQTGQKQGQRQEEDSQECVEDGRTPGAVLTNVIFRTCGLAMKWQEEGFPKLDFLVELRLQWLSQIDWRISTTPAVEEFIANFDLNSSQSRVEGRVVTLSPDWIARRLQIRNEGISVVLKKSKPSVEIQFFKDGAYTSDTGYRHDMARDSSLGRMFTLIAEAVLLRSAPHFSPAYFMDVIAQAKRGDVVNWAHCVYQKLKHKLRELKEKTSKGMQVKFTGGAWIAHLLAEPDANGDGDGGDVGACGEAVKYNESGAAGNQKLTKRFKDLRIDNIFSNASCANPQEVPLWPSPKTTTTTTSTTPLTIVKPAASPSSGPKDSPTLTKDSTPSTFNDLASTLEKFVNAQVQERDKGREKEHAEVFKQLEEELRLAKMEVKRLRDCVKQLEGLQLRLRESNENYKTQIVQLQAGNEEYKAQILQLEASEKELSECNETYKKQVSSLEKANGKQKWHVEVTQEQNKQLVRQVEEIRKKMEQELKQQDEQKQQMMATIAELRTELEAKSFPYGANIWERVQMEAWKQVRAGHKNLLVTIADLQEENLRLRQNQN